MADSKTAEQDVRNIHYQFGCPTPDLF